METMAGRVWVRRVLHFAAVTAAACSSAPTTPTGGTPTPTPAPTVTVCSASAPQPMTSFTADPAAITNGNPFTLRWAAPCGFVSLAQKGQGPFITLQPSTGSYALQTGQNGYPTAAGNTVYEARNGDTATPREATVTVNPAATPTPAAPTVSLSPASGTTCHPKKNGGVVTPCSVTFNASGTGYASLAWAGCCAGSTGTAGACHVNDITTTFTCTVTATGDGGTARANTTANGVNSPPTIGDKETYSLPTPLPLNTDNVLGYYTVLDPDGDGVACFHWAGSYPCVSYDTCAMTSIGNTAKLRFDVTSPAGFCTWWVQWQDEWGALATSPHYQVEAK